MEVTKEQLKQLIFEAMNENEGTIAHYIPVENLGFDVRVDPDTADALRDCKVFYHKGQVTVQQPGGRVTTLRRLAWGLANKLSPGAVVMVDPEKVGDYRRSNLEHKQTESGEKNIAITEDGSYRIKLVRDGKEYNRNFKRLEDAVLVRDCILEFLARKTLKN